MSAYTVLNVISLICLIVAMVLMALGNMKVGKAVKNGKILRLVAAGLFAVGILLLPVASLAGHAETFIETHHSKLEDEEEAPCPPGCGNCG